MKSAVLDCSAAVELLAADGLRAFQEPELADCIFVAPHLIDPEFVSAMRRHARRQPEKARQSELAIQAFYRLDIVRMEHEPLWQEAWRWRENLTAYDGMYVALARLLDVPLLTADGRLASAARPWCDVLRVADLLAA
ncbi:type II toxin-antitoxin system VapC family toxin [Leifsonia sp. NPDC077715]|uniref:type II toxin-antitoxin system VapC family toxin n=1 Tax=Leifsonia sp. NPDC077715 TaxID=3155539 RepID=UPI00343E5A38